MHLELPQQLNCPICMSVFKIPITTECGHSFCRSCLINSSKNRKACPICRNEFQSSPQKLKQDDTLSRILQDYVALSIRPNKTNRDPSIQSKSQSMLLLDVKTSQLLLPYNRILVTFELQNPILLNKCQRIVARQEAPFNKFGVISRIIGLKKLRNNLYECVMEGKSFCVIEEVIEENKLQQQDLPDVYQQFTYRKCVAKQILQPCSINLNQLQPFLMKLKQIKDPQILSRLYDNVDYNVFVHYNDPLALIYSIFELMDIGNGEKYQVLTKFDDERRLEVIRAVVARIGKRDVSADVKEFVKVGKGKGYGVSGVVVFVIVFLVLLVINSGEGEF